MCSERPGFLPPLAEDPACHDCARHAEQRLEVDDCERGLLLVCPTCARLRKNCGRDPFA
jgi:hypothetical protein